MLSVVQVGLEVDSPAKHLSACDILDAAPQVPTTAKACTATPLLVLRAFALLRNSIVYITFELPRKESLLLRRESTDVAELADLIFWSLLCKSKG